MQQGGGIHPLPSEYQEVEYLSRGAGNSYFVFQLPREYNPCNATYRYRVRYPNKQLHAVYSAGISNFPQLRLFNENDNVLSAYNGGTSICNVVCDYVGKWADIEFVVNSSSASIKAVVEGNTFTNTRGGNVGFTTSTARIGRIVQNYYYFNGDLAYIEAEDANGYLFWMVACYRKSDNVAGFYDVVNNEFHPSDASPWIAGPDV